MKRPTALGMTLRLGTAVQALTLLGAGAPIAMITTPVAAQDFTQVAATGKVQGTNGEPVVGATVTITSNAQGFSRTATTGNDGGFRVPALPIGVYTFSITAEGFDTFVDNRVNLTQSSSANQFTLAATGAAGGDIVVTAGRVQVADFDRNTVGSVVQVGELAARVPVSRDLTSVVLLAPGANGGDSAFGSLPAIAGSSVSENAFFINGLNITNQRTGLGSATVPFEFIAQSKRRLAQSRLSTAGLLAHSLTPLPSLVVTSIMVVYFSTTSPMIYARMSPTLCMRGTVTTFAIPNKRFSACLARSLKTACSFTGCIKLATIDRKIPDWLLMRTLPSKFVTHKVC